MIISQQVRLLIGSLFMAVALATTTLADSIASPRANGAAGLRENCEGMMGGLPPCAGHVPTPEPATMALVGSGLGMMLAGNVRKRSGRDSADG